MRIEDLQSPDAFLKTGRPVIGMNDSAIKKGCFLAF